MLVPDGKLFLENILDIWTTQMW